MRTSTDLISSALDGFQTNGDIGKYLSASDIDELKRVEPRIVEAYRCVETANRDFELICKGALSERNAR